jgi:meso-butanediol dehydrogenase / (S,S)-butanediol dehydrogenase / diacetyl reductase
MSFVGKVVIVTGAGGGIGGAVARSFASEKAKVVIVDSKIQSAKIVEQDINLTGGIAVSEKVDVRNLSEIARAIENTVNKFGRIDILVNCAGISIPRPFVEITEDLWNDTIDVNAKGTFFFCQLVAKQMIKQGGGGKIVNISSMLGKIGAELYAHYCASKFAVTGFTKSLALELAKHQINVNAVCPGDVDTKMTHNEAAIISKVRGVSVEQIISEWEASGPQGKLIQPSEVADLILFLSSEEAKRMTGQSVNITGGKLMI